MSVTHAKDLLASPSTRPFSQVSLMQETSQTLQTFFIAVSIFLRLRVMITGMSKDPSFLKHHDWGVLTISLLSRDKLNQRRGHQRQIGD